MSTDIKSKALQEKQKRSIEQKIEAQKQKIETEKFNKKVTEEVNGAYKRAVIDAFLQVFTKNYGDEYDQQSLIDSIKFTNSPDGLRPDFSFDERKLKFKPDFAKNIKKFNENAKDNFDGRNMHIDPDLALFDQSDFDSIAEQESYINSFKDNSALQQVERSFIPTSSRDRYGTLNRINKLGGFTPRDESFKTAEKQARKLWKTAGACTIANIIKNIK